MLGPTLAARVLAGPAAHAGAPGGPLLGGGAAAVCSNPASDAGPANMQHGL
jgi:hypothetical protein